jgi:hypothetical protein
MRRVYIPSDHALSAYKAPLQARNVQLVVLESQNYFLTSEGSPLPCWGRRESGALRSYLRGLVILSSCRLSMLFSAAVIGCTWTRTHSQLNSSAVVGGIWNKPLQGWSRRKYLRHLLTPLVQWVEDDIAPERDSLRVPGALIRRKQSTRAATPTTQLTLSASNPESNERDWIVSRLLQMKAWSYYG